MFDAGVTVQHAVSLPELRVLTFDPIVVKADPALGERYSFAVLVLVGAQEGDVDPAGVLCKTVPAGLADADKVEIGVNHVDGVANCRRAG